jgi:hypothetical protein
MTEPLEAINDGPETFSTPHIFISGGLRMPTKSVKDKVEEKLANTFHLERQEIEVLMSAAADITQLKKAIENPFKFNLGWHSYTYVEFDVVTWKIFPSPENVRFEDQRFGLVDASRFGSIDTVAPVLSFHAGTINKLIDSTENESRDIMSENPHTKTIALRGIEVGGWLSFARISADGLTKPITILESTDGFSRTVGAHQGLSLSPREALRLINVDAELEFRKNLIDLRESSTRGVAIGESAETKLRCSIMRRAKVIVGYEYLDKSGLTPKFDRARRTLVGHLHLAPQFGFSQSANAATKASEICSALESSGHIPVVDGLTPSEVSTCLRGNLEPWLAAGLTLDQYAPFVLSAYRPNLLTRQGKVIKQAIENLTGQSIKSDELADIASEVAIRAILMQRKLQQAQVDQMILGLRSLLGKTWQLNLFAGLTFTNRTLDEIYQDAVNELEFEMANPGNKQATSDKSRAELAAMASLLMAAVANPPLLVRAPGRAGLGNNQEPSTVMSELIRLHAGLAQLRQVVEDIRGSRDVKQIVADPDDSSGYKVAGQLADPSTIKDIYLQPSVDTRDYEKSSVEILNESLREMAHKIIQLEDLVDEISKIKSEQGVFLITQDGMPMDQELENLSKVQAKLSHWNYIAQDKLAARIEENSEG